MAGIPWIIVWLALAASARAQVTCENYGVPINSSACACPPGFGGATCSTPACGGDIFQGVQRPLVSGVSATSFGNVSTPTCACPEEWTGTGCNVCQAPTVCQSSFIAAGGDTGNGNLTCNTNPQVFAAGEMSCAVINPTIQAVFPLSATLTILRTLNTSLTPQPNATSFGASGSVYAQLWYDGIEQFYCNSNGCTQNVSSSNDTTWTCSNFQCTCRPGAAFCGGGALNLTSTIDGLDGELTLACDPLTSNGTASCNFQQSVLQSLFGSSGLSLDGCTFGECVRQSVIDATSGTKSGTKNSAGGSNLRGGFIGGRLATLGALIALAL